MGAEFRRFLAHQVMASAPVERAASDDVAGPAAVAMLRATDEGRARAQLGVYRAMYSSRLHASLREDFPAVHGVLGEVDFGRMCAAFLAVAPSRAPSLRGLGQPLPAFLARRGRADLADLARLEWARIEAFDAIDEVPLDVTTMIGGGPGAAARAVRAPASLRLVAVGHDVEAVWSAVDRGQPVPTSLAARTGVVAVWKRDLIVWHRRVEPRELSVLQLLRRGTTVEGLCAALGSVAREDDAAAVWQRLQRWLGDGMVIAARPKGTAAASHHRT